MGQRALLLVSVLAWGSLLGGCFGSHPFEEAESGTRLRAVRLVPAEGEATLIGWHDAELDVECSFFSAADGRTRCLPGGAMVTSFADATCETPARELGCEPAFLLDMLASAGCPTHNRVYEPAEARHLDRLYHRMGADCVELSAEPIDARVYVELPPDHFVGADFAEVEGSGRIGLRGLVGEDGSHQRGGLWDRERDESCGLRLTPSAMIARAPCVPLYATAAVRRAGPSCEDPYALSYDSECGTSGTPEVAVESIYGECYLERYDVYDVGAPVPLEELDAVECRVPSGATGAFGLTAAPPERLVWFDVHPVGSTRLQRMAAEEPSGIAVPLGWYYDAELEMTCHPQRFADGVVRCAPSEPAVSGPSGFADPECTRPAWRDSRAACLTAVVEPAPFDACGSSPGIEHVYRVAEAVDRSYEIDPDGNCVEAIVPPGYPTAHALEELPAERLVPFERVVD